MRDCMDFREFYEVATGNSPYPYQEEIAREGLPDILEVQTGAGKTNAVVLPWLYRKLFHPSELIRKTTQRWLVMCVPLRSLTDQTVLSVSDCIKKLSSAGYLKADEVSVLRAMGGNDNKEDQFQWKMNPERPTIIVGTLDMLLSRALNRGYVMSRFQWSIDFGLFNNGVHWIFDEIQLMGAGLTTSLQLQAFRDEFGTISPSKSTWMSATIDDDLRTVDNVTDKVKISLSEEDRENESLRNRIEGKKTISELTVSKNKCELEVGKNILEKHVNGTVTIGVFNTVKRAQNIYKQLKKQLRKYPKLNDIELILIHSRFRQKDRQSKMESILKDITEGSAGRIVISTQVIEAGIDISCRTLFTEISPWSSLVQRCGRCNRYGTDQDAKVFWFDGGSSSNGPYSTEDNNKCKEKLTDLDGETLSPSEMCAIKVDSAKKYYPTLRKSDLIGLFDTVSDLGGNDVDISQFIRDTENLNVFLGWRDFTQVPDDSMQPLNSFELCPVACNSNLKKFVVAQNGFSFNQKDGGWVKAYERDIYPGKVVLLRSKVGKYSKLTGYNNDIGFEPSLKNEVESFYVNSLSPGFNESEESISSDSASITGKVVELQTHLNDTKKKAEELTSVMLDGDENSNYRQAVILGCSLHDIGKAHDTFQEGLKKVANNGSDGYGDSNSEKLLAKSGGVGRIRYSKKYFRHELASALMLLGDAGVLLKDITEKQLTIYLIASHHGRIRVGIRSGPDEIDTVLGVSESDTIRSFDLNNLTVPECTLSLSSIKLGFDDDSRSSWSHLALNLRDRKDLGIFRLSFLEALVRISDWKASSIVHDDTILEDK